MRKDHRSLIEQACRIVENTEYYLSKRPMG